MCKCVFFSSFFPFLALSFLLGLQVFYIINCLNWKQLSVILEFHRIFAACSLRSNTYSPALCFHSNLILWSPTLSDTMQICPSTSLHQIQIGWIMVKNCRIPLHLFYTVTLSWLGLLFAFTLTSKVRYHFFERIYRFYLLSYC